MAKFVPTNNSDTKVHKTGTEKMKYVYKKHHHFYTWPELQLMKETLTLSPYKSCSIYYIVGKFLGVQFSQMVDLYHFAGLILADAHTHAHYVLYNLDYFNGVIFAVRPSSMKTMKI